MGVDLTLALLCLLDECLVPQFNLVSVLGKLVQRLAQRLILEHELFVGFYTRRRDGARRRVGERFPFTIARNDIERLARGWFTF